MQVGGGTQPHQHGRQQMFTFFVVPADGKSTPAHSKGRRRQTICNFHEHDKGHVTIHKMAMLLCWDNGKSWPSIRRNPKNKRQDLLLRLHCIGKIVLKLINFKKTQKLTVNALQTGIECMWERRIGGADWTHRAPTDGWVW